MLKKVLITGGAGFIGSHLLEELLNRGDEVVVVDNLSTGRLDNLPIVVQSECGYEFLKMDVSQFIDEHFHKYVFDEIYHLAATVGVKKVLEDPMGCVENNLNQTKLLLAAIANSFYKDKVKLFFSSTSEVYGKNDKWKLKETDDRIMGDTSKTRWVYAESKAMDEFLVNDYTQTYSVNAVIARFFNIVGERQSSQYGMVLPKFIEQALNNNPITVYGDGQQIRSFMYVKDCVQLILKLMRTSCTDNYIFNNKNNTAIGTYNIGNYDPIMIKDLAWRVKQWCGGCSEIEMISYCDAYSIGFEDMLRRVPDMEKIHSLFPQMNIKFKNIDQIILDMINYYRGKV